MQFADQAVLYNILLETKGRAPFPQIGDRHVWDSRQNHPVAKVVKEVAAREAGEPVPALESGSLTGYIARRARLSALVLAECLSDDGKLIAPITALLEAICAEANWSMVDDPRQGIDLHAAGTGLLLAEAVYLLCDRLSAAVCDLVRQETRRRLTDDFLRDTGSADTRNPVTSAGLTAVALYLESDPRIQARVLVKAMAGLPIEEAPCWSFRFGHYAVLSHLVETRTEGRVNLLGGERTQEICRFPALLELSPGKFVNFTDCNEDLPIAAGICCWLGQRCDVPELVALGRRLLPALTAESLLHEDGLFRPAYLLRALLWADDQPAPAVTLPAVAFFEHSQWMVTRHDPTDPNGLVLACKGGNNGEEANHNDVGQFIVHCFGESFVVDPGPRAPGARRWESLEYRSRGHSVPVVNRREQATGRQYGSHVTLVDFTESGNLLELELSDAYAEDAGIESIRRRFSLIRLAPRGQVIVRDDFHFEDPPNLYESRIHTYATPEQVAPGHLRLRGRNGTMAVRYDASVVGLRMEKLQPDESSNWEGTLHRLRFLQLAHKDSMLIRFVPE